MTALASAVMLASGTVCLGGAVAARSRIGIVAATIMALAMFDHVLFGLVQPVVWAALLVAAGGVLGYGLRQGVSGRVGATVPPNKPSVGSRLQRAVMTASALSYPAMAWLMLGHDHSAGGAAGSGVTAGGHAGHGSLMLMLPSALIAVLALVLLVLCVLTAARRMVPAAVEAGAMAAMLIAMLVPGLLGL